MTPDDDVPYNIGDSEPDGGPTASELDAAARMAKKKEVPHGDTQHNLSVPPKDACSGKPGTSEALNILGGGKPYGCR